MTLRRWPAAALALALAALAAAPARALDVPPLTGPVVDRAGLLDPGDARRLDALARAAWEQPAEKRVQLQYLVVPSLEGDALEDYAVRAFQAWKLGERGKDNGVLVVLARDDRKVRIETGYGAEGALTDAQSSRIIRNTMAPAFREGRFGDGLYDAGVQILSALGALPATVAARHAARPSQSGGLGALLIILVVIAVLFLRAATSFGPRRRRWGGFGTGLGAGLGVGLGSRRWGGGGGSWGGFGGGGGGSWGGGGGGSGGGGASGGW